jgi:FKBP-type peptidyl-prolyl cis-trans isomerase FkpA
MRRNMPKLAAEKERGATFAKNAAKAEGAHALESGVVMRTLSAGQGAQPKKTDRVRVQYEGRLIDGTVFDSSAAHGGPTELRLDAVIRCWAEGVPHMKIGEKAQLVCPPTLAYGDQGRPPQIPGGATLVFDIELLGMAQ